MEIIKKFALGAILCVGTLNLAQATQFTYNFSPSGMGTIDGLYYYEWGLSWNLPSGQSIVDATLTYSSIYLTTADANPPAKLYSTLLNSAPKGVTSYYDGDNNVQNPGPGPGVFLLGTAPFGGVGSGYSSLQYDFANITGALSALNADIADGVFGIGIDPDCYYSVGGIKLTITTSDQPPGNTRVPDAASTAMLLGAALTGIGLLRRKNK